MLGKIFKNRQQEEAFKKAIAVYISDKYKQVIIAPFSINNDGIYYEQERCYVADFPIEPSMLGSEIIRNLNLFSREHIELVSRKASDWPAYRHSRSKSVTSFETDYIYISVESVNDSNLILAIEGSPYKESDLTIKSNISFYADKEDIGQRLLAVYNACVNRSIP